MTVPNFILLSILILLIAANSGCSTVNTKVYYENGQLKEETSKSGVIFSEGKTFVVKGG